MKKIIALSFLSLGLVLLTGCSQQQINQNQSTTPAPVVQQPSQPIVNENQNSQSTVVQSQDTNLQVNQPQDIVYSNLTYGFTLTLPQTWKDYITKNRTLSFGTFGTSDSIDFGFAVQDSLFNISVHSKSQWQKIKSEEGPAPTYLGENSQYVFGYAPAQYAANDLMVARMKEIKDIVKTFEVTK
ncbi:MAG: hypothetical protein WC697_01500 [Patescibacteria group bacterium]|jgi:hypothetical protein